MKKVVDCDGKEIKVGSLIQAVQHYGNRQDGFVAVVRRLPIKDEDRLMEVTIVIPGKDIVGVENSSTQFGYTYDGALPQFYRVIEPSQLGTLTTQPASLSETTAPEGSSTGEQG